MRKASGVACALLFPRADVASLGHFLPRECFVTSLRCHRGHTGDGIQSGLALFENSIETIGAHAAISFSISADSYVLPSLSVTITFQPSLTKIFAFAAIISRLSRSTFTVSFSRSAIIL